ncbi:hypothetical protein K5549_006894 [Capra hircus]|nr:hypothetical protein K5549_006894 [Capra hircus]
MEEWTILLNFNPKLASRRPVRQPSHIPRGVSVRSFSREASTWYCECLMRKMCRVALALQWSSLDVSSSSPDSRFLFRRLTRDSGSLLTLKHKTARSLGSQTPGPGRAAPAHAGGSTTRGSASPPARGFPTATAEKSTAAEPPARPQAASCSACRNAMPVKSRVDRTRAPRRRARVWTACGEGHASLGVRFRPAGFAGAAAFAAVTSGDKGGAGW